MTQAWDYAKSEVYFGFLVEEGWIGIKISMGNSRQILEREKSMNPHKEWWIEQRCKKTVEKLKGHDFEAVYVKTKEEAIRQILEFVTPVTKVGVGGSITIRELGVLDQLKAKGNTVFDHWVPGLSREESLEIRKAQMSSDLFLSSSNAITMNGELVNIDGVGNRVNAINFGPKKVILVAGFNKIAGDVDEAIVTTNKIFGWRVKATKNSFLNTVLGSAKGVIVPHPLVKSMGDIMIINKSAVPSYNPEDEA